MQRILFIFFILISVLLGKEHLNLLEEKNRALQSNKLILLSIESDNCPYCVKMNKEVFSNLSHQKNIRSQYVQKIVRIQDVILPEGMEIRYFPTNIILEPKDMSVLDEFVGYLSAEDFLPLIDLVYEQER